MEVDEGKNVSLKERMKRAREHVERSRGMSVSSKEGKERDYFPEAGPLAKKRLIDEGYFNTLSSSPSPFYYNSSEIEDVTERQNRIKKMRKKAEEAALKSEISMFQPLQSVALRATDRDDSDVSNVDLNHGTSWRPPQWAIDRWTSDQRHKLKEKGLEVIGTNPPPAIFDSFASMRFPHAFLHALSENGIAVPTPVQGAALPSALSGRDLIAVGRTGSGKTLVFGLPLLALCFEEEIRMRLEIGEGPFALVMCPSRELAKQTHEVLVEFAESISSHGKHRQRKGHGKRDLYDFPPLKIVLLIGGQALRDQEELLRRGVHAVVGTPGRIVDLLTNKKGRSTYNNHSSVGPSHRSPPLSLSQCKYLVLDEADRMVDEAFESEVRFVIDSLGRRSGKVQKVLFSATMPKKIRAFAKSALTHPIEVNANRAGSCNLDVFQEVSLVREERKLPFLLSSLTKTRPPVLIFCEGKVEVDNVTEYLLLKGVEAVSIHGGKDQEERLAAIKAFRGGEKDVLVATDVASKGLHFDDVQHVINFVMPQEIDDYVHRIGRTGRNDKTGTATTFLSRSTPRPLLLDLVHLLIESKQRIPPCLFPLKEEALEMEQRKLEKRKRRQMKEGMTSSDENSDDEECEFCGGLGHSIADCNKMMSRASSRAPPREEHIGATDW